MEERRKHKREPLSPHLKIVIPDDDTSFGAFITNLSSGGVEVYADHGLSEGQSVLLYISFESDPKRGKNEVVEGTVKWVKNFGTRFLMGIEFQEIHPDKHPVLISFLKFLEK